MGSSDEEYNSLFRNATNFVASSEDSEIDDFADAAIGGMKKEPMPIVRMITRIGRVKRKSTGRLARASTRKKLHKRCSTIKDLKKSKAKKKKSGKLKLQSNGEKKVLKNESTRLEYYEMEH